MAENTPGTSFSDTVGDPANKVTASKLQALVKNAVLRNFAPKSVGASHLDGTVAGSGLKGGDGLALRVNPDGTTLELNGDALRLKDASVTADKLHADLLARITALEEKPEPYPVGAIVYNASADFAPAELYGGTWEKIRGKFLWAEDDAIPAAATGGTKTHTLTMEEMPRHSHGLARHGASNYNGADAPTATYNSGATMGYTAEAGGYAGGGSSAHNNMPPYVAVYCWQRTA